MRLAAPCLAALAIGAATTACRENSAWPPTHAAPMELGEDACANCRMIISDQRYGAELLDRSGKAELYDDLGCLLGRTIRPGARAADPEAIFVRSFPDGKWIRGDRAFVVHARGLSSPMGHGYAAFESLEAAHREAAKWSDAEVATLAEVLRHGVSALPGQHTAP